jgi:hypothetical protein
MQACGVNSTGSGERPVADFRVNGDELSQTYEIYWPAYWLTNFHGGFCTKDLTCSYVMQNLKMEALGTAETFL